MANVYDDIPRSFDEAYLNPSWAQQFRDWADQQPDWTGPLTRAVFEMGAWQGGGVAEAATIVDDLVAASPPLDPTVTLLDPALHADGDGNVDASFFYDTWLQAYEILSADRFIYPAFYQDHNQALADRGVDGKRHFEAKRGVPEEERTDYVTRSNVWIQSAHGDPEILASELGEADRYWEPSAEQYAFAAAVNEARLKDAEDGENIPFWQWFHLVLIGDADVHIPAGDTMRFIKGDPAESSLKQICMEYGVEGSVVIEKGSLGSRGSLTFTGAHDPDAVRRHVAQFSKKPCSFE